LYKTNSKGALDSFISNYGELLLGTGSGDKQAWPDSSPPVRAKGQILSESVEDCACVLQEPEFNIHDVIEQNEQMLLMAWTLPTA
jgi:hypothetical protein